MWVGVHSRALCPACTPTRAQNPMHSAGMERRIAGPCAGGRAFKPRINGGGQRPCSETCASLHTRQCDGPRGVHTNLVALVAEQLTLRLRPTRKVGFTSIQFGGARRIYTGDRLRLCDTRTLWVGGGETSSRYIRTTPRTSPDAVCGTTSKPAGNGLVTTHSARERLLISCARICIESVRQLPNTRVPARIVLW